MAKTTPQAVSKILHRHPTMRAVLNNPNLATVTMMGTNGQGIPAHAIKITITPQHGHLLALAHTILVNAGYAVTRYPSPPCLLVTGRVAPYPLPRPHNIRRSA